MYYLFIFLILAFSLDKICLNLERVAFVIYELFRQGFLQIGEPLLQIGQRSKESQVKLKTF